MKNLFLILIIALLTIGCNSKSNIMKPYVLEVTSFKYKETVKPNDFWIEDAKVETNYTNQQLGFISRESGHSKNDNEVIVVVRWKTQKDAEASMKKFMTDESVKFYANMIDGSSMKMKRYEVK